MMYEIDEKDVSLVIGLLSRLADTTLFTPAVYANEIVPLSRRLSALERVQEVELIQVDGDE